MSDKRDIIAHNSSAWDKQVEDGNQWTLGASPEEIAAARRGDWTIVLTPNIPVPHAWLPNLDGSDVLCLASGGGQQGPILAAAGARVTVLDNSGKQLEQDKMVAAREGLTLRTIQGPMDNLSMLADASFDYIVHPVSNVFAPEIRPVWHEAYRVLRPGGTLIAGAAYPFVFLFDWELAERTGEFKVVHKIPYADTEFYSAAEQAKRLADGHALEFSHTLDDQLGGQLDAGFVLTGFFEDRDRPADNDQLSKYIAPYFATRALKPAAS